MKTWKIWIAVLWILMQFEAFTIKKRLCFQLKITLSLYFLSLNYVTVNTHKKILFNERYSEVFCTILKRKRQISFSKSVLKNKLFRCRNL